MNPFRICPVLFRAFVIISLAASAFGTTTATLTGRVTDPSGAVVPGTKVTATNVDTNISSSTQTNEVGLYVIPDLPPGRYRMILQKQGFETIVKPDVVLHVADVIGLNFSMQVGSISQSMTVEGGAPLIQTETTQLGDVIGGRTMTSLPLNGRSYVDLLGLQAGVIPSQLNTGFINTSDRPVSGTLSAGNVSVNGQREAANSFLVNGGDVEEGNPEHPASCHLVLRPRPVHDLHDPADEENLAHQDPRRERPVPLQRLDTAVSVNEGPHAGRRRLLHGR